eukprot:TRINITY_DN3904_c0_g1_i1.p1 TRINITY_DN3904_c0_g1~~TRINITY_DN3904_c0_g1_i1.p1  ORF type:complete len:220 (-),score=56.56 TRINITY_DN3904_c0_g1_i1:273-932(-)
MSNPQLIGLIPQVLQTVNSPQSDSNSINNLLSTAMADPNVSKLLPQLASTIGQFTKNMDSGDEIASVARSFMKDIQKKSTPAETKTENADAEESTTGEPEHNTTPVTFAEESDDDLYSDPEEEVPAITLIPAINADDVDTPIDDVAVQSDDVVVQSGDIVVQSDDIAATNDVTALNVMHHPYASELSILKSMGYTDEKQLLDLLEKHRGNTQQVIEELI